MMKTIQYKITFYSYWHSSSGLAKGTETDNLVIKDAKKLPYLPGKTLKGLLKDAAFTLLETGVSKVDEAFITKAFGKEVGDEPESKTGECRFSNAVLPENEAQLIIEKNLSPYLYKTISSTALEKDRMARENSLRSTEVIVPLTLEASIDNVDAEDEERWKQCMQMIKRVGLKRHRGLGRCQFTIKE